jgi:hypothetical protein
MLSFAQLCDTLRALRLKTPVSKKQYAKSNEQRF